MLRKLLPKKVRRRLSCQRRGHLWVEGYKHSMDLEAGQPPIRYCRRCGRVDHSFTPERVTAGA
jgi:hypothetical protein